jgi:protein TonB
MPLRLALLLSLILHLTLILAPAWPSIVPTARQPRIEVSLPPPEQAVSLADNVATEPGEAEPTMHPPPEPPRLAGAQLRRAQAAVSRHLYYPPEAVAKGLEGEVILLLTLSTSGQLTGVEIARSSGHALLDQAALDAARRIGGLPGSKRQLLFPIRFRLL